MTQRQALSEIAHRALSVVSRRAEKQGLDLFEELNRVGLIATEPRIREIQVSTLQNFSDRLEDMNISHVLMKNNGSMTADDMLRHVKTMLSDYILVVKDD